MSIVKLNIKLRLFNKCSLPFPYHSSVYRKKFYKIRPGNYDIKLKKKWSALRASNMYQKEKMIGRGFMID